MALTRDQIYDEIADLLTDNIDAYFMDARDAESPAVSNLRCTNCGATVTQNYLDTFDTEGEDETGFWKQLSMDGECPVCNCRVTFQHQWCLEDARGMRVHDGQRLDDPDIDYYVPDNLRSSYGYYDKKNGIRKVKAHAIR